MAENAASDGFGSNLQGMGSCLVQPICVLLVILTVAQNLNLFRPDL